MAWAQRYRICELISYQGTRTKLCGLRKSKKSINGTIWLSRDEGCVSGKYLKSCVHCAFEYVLQEDTNARGIVCKMKVKQHIE